mmetsp:Transcript_14986/g.20334  ORF Transcript_14986/g.20334 Transcript_14986/m.20334 type:complete len:137 (+) Transcript_14986:456-866(+)
MFFFKIPHIIFETKFVIFSCYALLLLADSWLAYKTTLVSGFAIYFISFLQLCFRSGRPFWDVSTITSNNQCLFDFAGPSEAGFLMTFFWPYVMVMFGFKYYKNPKVFINFLLMGVLLFAWVAAYAFTVVNGLDYIY